MTLDEFLLSLEARMNEELKRRAENPRYSLVGDDIIIQGLPSDHNTPVEGVWWTLGSNRYKHALQIKLTHKAFLAWKRGQFEKLLPQNGESYWFDFDEENTGVTIRLHSH